MTPASASTGTGRRRVRALLRWVRTHPGLTVALVAPWLLFGAPVLVGKVFLDGDNFLQNFPLRVLVGQDLHHGMWPLLNSYLFGGTPLLGGFNAGAAYPATWLFAILPSQTAWTLNLVLVYDAALAGTYLFLRRQPVSPTAATLGAVSFAFFGFMSGQIVHIDIIEGASWLPWMLLAVHALTTPPTTAGPAGHHQRRRRWWAGLLMVSSGLTMLAGGPEAFLDGAVLVALYLIYRVIDQRLLLRRHWRWSLPSLAAVVTGAVGGVALGAAQLVPGLAFLGQSQRSASTYGFFTSGSLPIRTVSLAVSPFVLGTNQSAAPYVGEYNFPEVTSYLGIVSLIAAFALFGARWRHRPEARHWWVWYVVMAVGLLSALGSQTPFGHLLYVIPGVNAQRLLNRNLLLVDFSLAMLAAWFVHLLLESRPAVEGPAPAGPTVGEGVWRPGRRAESILTCVPATVIAVVCLLLWMVPDRVISALAGSPSLQAGSLRLLAVVSTVELVIAVAGTAVVLAANRWTRPTLRRLLTAVLVVDLVVFTALTLHPPTTKTAAHARGAMAQQFSSLIGDGRFIIYDPDEFEYPELYLLGQTDLNVIRHQASGQGYAALVDNGYYNATGAHYQEDLDVQTLAGPVWDQLNARVLLSLPSYFVTPEPGSKPSTPFPAPATDLEDAGPGPVTVKAGESHRWYLGGVLTAQRGTIPAGGRTGPVRIGMVTPTGGTEWLPTMDVTTTRSGTTFTLPSPTPIAGLVLQNEGGDQQRLDAPTLQTVDDGGVVLNGRLQGNVSSPHWEFTGTIGSFGVFRNTRVTGWAWAEGLDGGRAPAGTTVTGGPPAPDGTQAVTVHTAGPVTLVRSMAWTTGWHATLQAVDPMTGRNTGAATNLTVRQYETVQRVAVPAAGTYVVTFTYRTSSAVLGLVVSSAAGTALLVWALVEVIGVRRRRRRRRVTSAGPGRG